MPENVRETRLVIGLDWHLADASPKNWAAGPKRYNPQASTRHFGSVK